MRLNCAIFDMDGTLLDSMWMWDRQGEAILRAYGKEPAPDFRRITRPMGMTDAANYCCQAYGLPVTSQEVVGEMNRRMEHFYTCEVKAKPGVEEFLLLLKMEGVRMYVATATQRPLVEKALRCAGLEGYFKGIITCDEVGASKAASAKVFDYAMRRLGGNKLDTVIFEDSWAAIRTAKAEGFRVAGIFDNSMAEHWEEICAAADYSFRSFRELSEQG